MSRNLEGPMDTLDGTVEPLTVTLRDGSVVLAKNTKHGTFAVTYANRAQANARAAIMGAGWEVIQRGRPLFVRKVTP